ncbi:hypothetical protein POM88_011154 [Heracleum sosnowskyi]|uniref:Conserved oligomeric Golgi complex subunit 1 n=1 Tax=Heracleum sosnowskyi TaxID=360622 RepID=A0AAD8IWB5_9APIA|nr:hypothetical protein POM88_011154 [Heracleum sosnowskyi]
MKSNTLKLPTGRQAAMTEADSIACRVKYLVDTPDIIQGYLDKFMLLESATRFMTAKYVHCCLDQIENYNNDLNNHWNIIVESFQVEISKHSRETLLLLDLSIDAYADALAAIMFIDRLPVFDLFLDSRMSFTLAQVGELFLQLSPRTIPLLKRTFFTSLNSPVSHLFSGIPNPDFEIVSWHSFAVTQIGLFDQTKRRFCLEWFDACGLRMLSDVNGDIFGKYLINIEHDTSSTAGVSKSANQSTSEVIATVIVAKVC